MTDITARPLAIITGASSGIGFELANVFASENYDLIIVAENDAIFQVAEQIKAHGVMVEAYKYDLTVPANVEDFFDAVIMSNRPVAAAALNAGVGIGGKFAETPLDAELNSINLNVVSTVHLTKLLVQHMISVGQGGRILFTASMAADMPGPYEAVYTASKAFVHNFAEAVRNEFEEYGITVTSLMPGPTETPFFERAGLENTKIGTKPKDDPAEVARQGFDGLMQGKDKVLGGSLGSQALATLNAILPDKVKADMAAGYVKPGSGGEG